MSLYIELVTSHPILMAVIQFAILGTLGEMIAKWIVKKKVFMPFSTPYLLWKMLVWMFLAVGIKYAFAGTKGFLHELVDHKLLPAAFGEPGFARAFGISFWLNIQFGFFLVIGHRFLDNLVLKVKSWDGIDKGLKSLFWFWIPAHTITFMLPKVYQIGLAALWSVALGIILGFANKPK